MTPDLQSTLDAIDDLAVHRCGQCDIELGPAAPSGLFCSPGHQEAFYAARSEALVGYREPVDLAAHALNQVELQSPKTTPRGAFRRHWMNTWVYHVYLPMDDVAPDPSAVIDPPERALEARRNRNTGPQYRQRAPRRIDSRGSR